ncbi:OmpA family protein [Serratia inhibens]|uniref:OmpA family protein n=1 Tax=Serratia inhibens TaxID=2338073 RepID=UPI00025E39AA|nr:OmpA family protein [Serratia inhibens]ANS44542.1 putative lipoprotein YiaD [Serratia inhibens PRI-2C]
MNRVILRYALISTIIGVLIAFGLSLTSTFALSLKPVLIMIGLLLLMVLLHCCYILRPPLQKQIEPALPQVTERPVMLILGPYAAKWFSQVNPNDDARFTNQAAWLLVAEEKEMTSRLHNIQHHAPDTPIMAFFPLLPDGHETSGMIIEALSHWQLRFSALLEGLTLPCILAIYVRLSNEQRSNNPNNATWIGEIDFNQQQAVSYTTAMDNIKSQLNAKTEFTVHDLQRAVMGKHLICWLDNSGLERMLSTLFTRTSLHLNSVLLCDYGNGFNRHGAWSSWLEQRYALLPGLGTTLTLPPFPPVKMPVPQVTNRQTASSRKRPIFFWSLGLVLLLLGSQILNASWRVHLQQQQYHQQIREFAILDDLSILTLKQRIRKMEKAQQAWSECSTASSLRYWGFSPCRRFTDEIGKRVTALKQLPIFSTQGPTPLFNSGSARLLPGAIPQLKEIETLVGSYPQRNILIIGHSDNTGNEDLNLVLSAQRADSVREWLGQQGVDIMRLGTYAAGAAEPIASNESASGRQRNRRVEIVILPTAYIKKEFTTP